MKNKTKTYILLVAVLGIWGIIGYKILSAFGPEKEVLNDTFQVTAFKPKTSEEIDTFSVKTVSRDPFLGTLTKKKKPIVKQKKVIPKPEFKWVPIIYHGAISNKSSKSQIFVVSINGKQHLMKIGQEVDGVKLKSAITKNIVVTYKGKRKTINKT